MYLIKRVLLSGLIALFPVFGSTQNVVQNPTASQTITQPPATNFTVQGSTILPSVNNLNNILWVDGVKYTTIAGCYNALPSTGGTCMVPPNYTETLTANLSLGKTNTAVVFTGPATINQGQYQVIIPAGTDNVSVLSNFPLNGNTPSPFPTPVLFTGYTGSGAAFQIGGTSANTMNIYLRGFRIDFSLAQSGAQGISITRTQQYWLEGANVNASIGCGAGCGSGTGMIGILIDGGGYFSGIGEINFPILNIGTNPSGSTNSVAIRVQNITTHTLIIGGHIQMTGTGTACFDVNGGASTSSELTFYAPNCESATTAITVEGNSHAVGDIRVDSGVSKLANFDSHSGGNKIRFVDACCGTVVDNGSNNSVEFPATNQVHGDLWQLTASANWYQVTNILNGGFKGCLSFNNSGNAWIGACGGGSLHVNEGSGTVVYFYNSASSPVAYIDSGGNAQFNGNLTVSGVKSFRIDDPLDPEKKYLYHAAVESPDMKNIYDGVAILGSKGTAVVNLPAYFEALNKDFRYQLTCIGGSAPVYVAREIRGNRFVIAGGRPGLRVSWQVTGIRHDAFANAHRMAVEQEKPAKETTPSPDPGPLTPAGAANKVIGSN